MTETKVPNGAFIALEGCDGAGKSSIRDELARLVRTKLDRDCVIVGQHSWLDPHSSRVIENVRTQRAQYTPDEIGDAYFHDKRAHAERTIGPAMESCWVLADRFIYSDAVYQQVLYGTAMQQTLDRHESRGTLAADLILYVDVDPDEAYRRIQKRSKVRRHYERPAGLTEIRAAYQELFGRLGPEVRVVRFVNDVPDWRPRVEMELLPAILSALASGAR